MLEFKYGDFDIKKDILNADFCSLSFELLPLIGEKTHQGFDCNLDKMHNENRLSLKRKMNILFQENFEDYLGYLNSLL